MSDHNLPPGVSLNDIPGNRPEDELFERILDDVLTHDDLMLLHAEESGDDSGMTLDEVVAEVLARYEDAFGETPFAPWEIIDAILSEER